MTERSGRAIFLDRDGVINQLVWRDTFWDSPRTAAEWAWLPGVFDGARRLRALGFQLIVATNQPSVRYGTMRAADLAALHAMMRERFKAEGAGLLAIAVCPHGREEGCRCRKPAPGLLLNIAARYAIDLSVSVVVGDRDRDVDAGVRAGCLTGWIRGHYPEPTSRVDFRGNDLSDIADQLQKGRIP